MFEYNVTKTSEGWLKTNAIQLTWSVYFGEFKWNKLRNIIESSMSPKAIWFHSAQLKST
jgi:hypothetical protein